jgi:sialic acid synthase SpsE
MDTMRRLSSGPVGYSDHTVDGLALLTAVGRGADVVERHITIKKNVANAQDWKVSSGPEDFSNFVKSIRRIESMIGDGVKKSADCEGDGKQWALKSLFAARDIGAGDAITSDDLISRRPGYGIPPSKMFDIVGKSLATNVKKGEMIKSDMLVNVASK